MPMTKFKASLWPEDSPIEEVLILRETDTAVYLAVGRSPAGKREPKRSHHVCYFNTFRQAKQYHIDVRTKQLLQAQQILQDSLSALATAEQLPTPPSYQPLADLAQLAA